uniref:Uncharacterized protein n=1 Tax=viral metagenome TaxID=1070528 RepID=A0A6C0C239_9ZZZZ
MTTTWYCSPFDSHERSSCRPYPSVQPDHACYDKEKDCHTSVASSKPVFCLSNQSMNGRHYCSDMHITRDLCYDYGKAQHKEYDTQKDCLKDFPVGFVSDVQAPTAVHTLSPHSVPHHAPSSHRVPEYAPPSHGVPHHESPISPSSQHNHAQPDRHHAPSSASHGAPHKHTQPEASHRSPHKHTQPEASHRSPHKHTPPNSRPSGQPDSRRHVQPQQVPSDRPWDILPHTRPGQIPTPTPLPARPHNSLASPSVPLY